MLYTNYVLVCFWRAPKPPPKKMKNINGEAAMDVQRKCFSSSTNKMIFSYVVKDKFYFTKEMKNKKAASDIEWWSIQPMYWLQLDGSIRTNYELKTFADYDHITCSTPWEFHQRLILQKKHPVVLTRHFSCLMHDS